MDGTTRIVEHIRSVLADSKNTRLTHAEAISLLSICGELRARAEKAEVEIERLNSTDQLISDQWREMCQKAEAERDGLQSKVCELQTELDTWKGCDMARAMEAQKQELLFFKAAFDDDQFPTDLHEWLNPVQAETLRTDHDRLAARCKELEEGLRRLEWIHHITFEEDQVTICEVCGVEYGNPHTSDCWLARLLEGEK